jgi:hypothetical protein
MTVRSSFRHRCVFPVWLTFLALTGVFWLALPLAAADKDKDKEKEKKVEPWVEIHSEHFIVASDGGEKTARRILDVFETLRHVIQATMPNSRPDTGIPIRILAAKDGKGFATIFPEFPYDKKQSQPEGLFVAGREKNYIALRANASGPIPYEEIFNTYARLVLKQSYRNLPPWLELGYASAYGGLMLGDKGVKLGHPNPEDLSALWQSPLLPLDLVLHVDSGSPYYTSGNKVTVFSAESRALVHYFLSLPQGSGTQTIERFIGLVEKGADPLQAARQTFGDLNQLQGKLDSYIKQSTSGPVDSMAVSGTEGASGAHTLSLAETGAMIGDFALARGRTGDAEEKLADAIKLDPSLASAEESLGYLAIQQQRMDDADTHFKRATQLDSKSALAYYGQGLVAMSRNGATGVPVGAIAAFERTVAAAPGFAPAWYNLSSLYSQRKETMQKALEAAQRAASLVPGDSGYQDQVAMVLQEMGRTDDGRKVADSPRKPSDDRAVADRAAGSLDRSPQPKTPAPAANASVAASAPIAERTLRIEHKEEPESKPVATASNAAPEKMNAPASPAISNSSESHVYSMVGKISNVNCGNAPQIEITVKALTIEMKLHAADAARLTIKSEGTTPLAKGSACSGLRGRTARVSYQFVQDKKWDAEIEAIELRNDL